MRNLGIVQEAERLDRLVVGRIVFDGQIGQQRDTIRRPFDHQRDAAPNQDDHGHHGRDHHDLERLAARFVNPQQILPEEIHGDQTGDDDRSPALHGIDRRLSDRMTAVFLDGHPQPDDVLTGRDAADRAGENIVEHQGRDGKLRQKAPHRLLDDPIDPAAHEQRAAFDIDVPHGIAEEHHRQNEIGGDRSDRRFDDPPDVIGGAGQIAEHDRGHPPIRDELEHHAVHDHHVRSVSQAVFRGRFWTTFGGRHETF